MSLPGYFADPYATYRALRDTDPVHYSESVGAFFVTRFDDVNRLTRDRTLMVNVDFATSTPMIDAERSRLQELHSPPTILQLHGDDHNRLRRLVTRVFTPKAIASWRDRADTIVEGLLAGAMQRDEIDLIDDYALILPAQIISEMLGMPSKDNDAPVRVAEAARSSPHRSEQRRQRHRRVAAVRLTRAVHPANRRGELGVGDREIPAGSVVFLGLGSANRDPRKWGPTADQLDLSRAGANEHQSFGGGAHYCLGAALARLEAQIAIPRLARRFPRMTPAYVTPAWSRRITLRGVVHLPVRLNHG